MWYSSVTKSIHYESDSIYAFALCDEEIARFYRSLIPKCENVRRPGYKPHITIIRTADVILKMDMWKKHEGATVPFEYSSEIDWNEEFWWLPVRCEFFATMREELGLPPGKLTYHMSIGTTKGI